MVSLEVPEERPGSVFSELSSFGDPGKIAYLVTHDEGSGSAVVNDNSSALKTIGGDPLVSDSEICDGPDGRVRLVVWEAV